MFGLSWWHLTLAIVLGTIGLGVCFTLGLGLMKVLLWGLTLTSRLSARLWAWLTGTTPSSYGTAHWATAREIDAKGLFRAGAIPLGTFKGAPLYEAMGGHVVLIAPPRSWKSKSFVAPVVAGYPGSVLVNDPRAELFAMCHVAREALGPTYRFSPTAKDSCALNVVDACRWGQDEAYGDVQRLVHGLLAPDVGEPWNDFRLEAKPLLEAMIHDRHAAGEGHLPGVLQWMTAPGHTMKAKAEALLRSPVAVVQAGGRRFLDKSDRLQSSVWSNALSALSIYGDPLVAANTDHSDVDLHDLQHGTRPVSLFLCPPFSEVARLRPILGALTEMVCALFSAQQDQPRQRVLLALDEMGNLGRLSELERGLSYLQGCGCQILQVWQNVLQCRQVYGIESPVLAGCGTAVFYTPGDPETADYLSHELGVTTERWHPQTERRSFWGFLSGTSIGTSEHARPLWTADECRRAPDTAAVIISKGLAPILGEKLGVPAPELIDVSTPTRKLCAAAVAAVCVLGLLAWQWPHRTPGLQMTHEVAPQTVAPAVPVIGTHEMDVPLEYTNVLPWTLPPDAPQTVRVRYVGPDAVTWPPIEIDLGGSTVRAGMNYYMLTTAMLRPPPDVQVQRLDPVVLMLTLQGPAPSPEALHQHSLQSRPRALPFALGGGTR